MTKQQFTALFSATTKRNLLAIGIDYDTTELEQWANDCITEIAQNFKINEIINVCADVKEFKKDKWADEISLYYYIDFKNGDYARIYRFYINERMGK